MSASESGSQSASPSAGTEIYSRESVATLPANDSSLATAYTSQDYLDVNSSNNVRVGVDGTSTYMVHLFKDFAGANGGVDITCELQSSLAPSSSPVYLQIYKHSTAEWQTLTSNDEEDADTDFTLTAHVDGLTAYKDEQNIITCRVYQETV